MSRQFASLVTLLVLIYAAPLPVHAGEAEAMAAYKKGDYITALRELKPLAEQGSANAQVQLGFMYANAEGVPQDYDQAMSWFRKAAEQQNATAQFNLGLMHYQGRGTPKDYTLASDWYRRAADQGYAEAQMKLGFMYANGEGIPQDYTQALAWYRKAAEQGNVAAQNNLGEMYYTGKGTPTDYTQAVMWYRKGVEQGDAAAQVNLGLAYDEGKGVPKDYAQAATWYRKAAEQGDPSGQNNLGSMYYNGHGVPKDHTLALLWYRKAAEQGNAEAKNNLSQLKFAQASTSQGTQSPATGTPLLAIHNSPDTHCEYRRQCTDAEFLGVLDSLQRQWALTPDWLRVNCATNSTYPAMEQCILTQTVSWLNTHPGQKAPWVNPDNFRSDQRRSVAAASEQFDSIDEAVSDCEIKQIATGQHFILDRTTGKLDLRSGSLRVVSACLNQSNAWIEQCIRESGNSEGCTKQSLLVPQMLIKDAWSHRDNLKAWEREALK